MFSSIQKSVALLGGMVANNGAGEKTLKYGQNKDFVARTSGCVRGW
jgi:FAD/FMN-containing dehydrogenase